MRTTQNGEIRDGESGKSGEWKVVSGMWTNPPTTYHTPHTVFSGEWKMENRKWIRQESGKGKGQAMAVPRNETLAMLMGVFLSTLCKPDDARKQNRSNGYCDECSQKHLVFSLRAYEESNNHISQQENIGSDFDIIGKFEEEFAGESSGYSDFRHVHQSRCQEFSPFPKWIHINKDNIRKAGNQGESGVK